MKIYGTKTEKIRKYGRNTEDREAEVTKTRKFLGLIHGNFRVLDNGRHGSNVKKNTKKTPKK